MFCAFCIYGVVVVIQFNGLYVLLEAETNAWWSDYSLLLWSFLISTRLCMICLNTLPCLKERMQYMIPTNKQKGKQYCQQRNGNWKAIKPANYNHLDVYDRMIIVTVYILSQLLIYDGFRCFILYLMQWIIDFWDLICSLFYTSKLFNMERKRSRWCTVLLPCLKVKIIVVGTWLYFEVCNLSPSQGGGPWTGTGPRALHCRVKKLVKVSFLVWVSFQILLQKMRLSSA